MKNKFSVSCFWLTTFILWTVTVLTVDRQAIGPMGSTVGLATLNETFHTLTGVRMELYHITDLLSIIPLTIVIIFALTGLAQWIRRKMLGAVDHDILALGGFYGVVMSLFVFFEFFPAAGGGDL